MTTPAQPPAKGKKQNRLVLGVIVLGVALAAGAYLLWRQRSSASAANAAAAAPATQDQQDMAGQIATLQAEVADLQSSFTQDEGGETGTTGTGSTVKLTAPAGLSVTPHNGYADFGWSKVDGAKAYQLQVAGAGGHGTGTSHYDHAGTATHAEKVRLAHGKYRARVRAGTSTASLTGPWTPYKDFSVSTSVIKAGGGPPKVSPQPGPGGGEGED